MTQRDAAQDKRADEKKRAADASLPAPPFQRQPNNAKPIKLFCRAHLNPHFACFCQYLEATMALMPAMKRKTNAFFVNSRKVSDLLQ